MTLNTLIDTDISRRKLLTRFGKGLGSGLLLSALPGFTSMAHAADDYKALVCVFLFGGNDGNNLIVPTDSTGFARYAAIRGDSTAGNGGIGIPQNQLLALAPAAGNAQYGLHPALSGLQQVWNAGDMAALFNVGTLVQPLTKAQYADRSLRPVDLFSHSDQQEQWQSGVSNSGLRTGWGGRLADAVQGRNLGSPLPPLLSLAGDPRFTQGGSTSALTLPTGANFGITEFAGGHGAAVGNALRQLLAVDRGSVLVASAQDKVTAGIQSSAALAPVLGNTNSAVNALFAGQNTGIAKQLLQVARIIEARASLGVARQIFFVSLGGFDTHNNQIAQQASLFGQLGPALKSFQDSMAQLGVSDQVTSFTMSDFGRTLKPASGGGSDHGWGNHHLIMGGAVRGQSFYGQFPEHALDGPDDVSTEGRWLPTTSVDQYAATLARWFGIADTDLATLFPNWRNFGSTDLGFMA